MPTVAGTTITANTKETWGGFTHVLGAPASLLGFAVPVGATIHTAKDGAMRECIQPGPTMLGATKLQKKARIADDRGRWLMWGFLGKKVTQGGLAIASGSPVRVRPDGTVAVAFSAEGQVLEGRALLEGTRLDWTGSGWHVEADGEYVPDADEDEDDEGDDVIVDDGDGDDE